MQQHTFKLFALFALLILSFSGYAQKFDWVTFIDGPNHQRPVNMSVDGKGNQYSTFYFYDQVRFGSYNLKFSSNYQKALALKQNAAGKVVWYSVIEALNSANAVYPMASRFNSKGNLIVFVAAQSDLSVGKDTIKRHSGYTSGHAFFMIEFNDTGKMVNSNHLIDGYLYNTSYAGNKITSDSNDNIYISLAYYGLVKVYDSLGVSMLGTSSSGGRNIILKFSKSGRIFNWASENLPYADVFINSLKVDIDENIYVATYWRNNTSFTFKGTTITNPQSGTGALFVLDKNGQDKNWFFIESSGSISSLYDVAAYDSNSILVSGSYIGDSARFGTTWKPNTKYGNYLFFALYDAKGNLKWTKVSDTTYGTATYANNYYNSMTNYKDSYFYLSFFSTDHINKPFIFDGQKYESKTDGFGINLKIDNRGNILWGFRTLFPFFFMNTDEENNLYFQGSFYGDTIHFGNIKSFPDSYDSYIGKTFDYSIFRGDIKSGPYCAGDSLYVPYTKVGNYADTNIFIAEISDAFGNFTGNEREIGRRKTNDSGVVKGILPLFKVASSGQYRIRIRSTSPQVQSYYKLDSLRLLIYSKDKADPGPPDTICFGDSIQINTYGGTKWTWSPAYNMSDSNVRQPLVWPMKDTTYKIIIADSSGCGQADTAFKKIVLRKRLQLSIAFNDTTVCDTSPLRLPMEFNGGDQTNYHWYAFDVSTTKNWKTLDSGMGKLLDTLMLIPKIALFKSQKLAIVLDDQCTNKMDTAYLEIHLRKPSIISNKLKDTKVCEGTTVVWKANTYNPNKDNHWQWKDVGNDVILSSADTLSFTVNNLTQIELTLNNGCIIDSNIFMVDVYPALNANILSGNDFLNDTALCYRETLQLVADGQGGLGKSFEFEWVFDGTKVSTSDTFNFSSDAFFSTKGGQGKLNLILKDNCTLRPDTFTRNITAFESPNSDFSYTTRYCVHSPVDFAFIGSIPKSPVQTTFHWNFNNEDTSDMQNPSKVFDITGVKEVTLKLISSNGCTDTLNREIEIRTQAKADFTATDLCESDTTVFVNKSEDATNYQWGFGDGENSNEKNPKHKFEISSTTTFIVSLVAILTDGCSDTITKAITVNQNPNSGFSYTSTGTKLELIADEEGLPNYKWTFGNSDSISVNNYKYTHIQQSGQSKICLTVTDLAGCTSETCKDITLGISEFTKPEWLNIYPNPNHGNFTIEIVNPSDRLSIEIFDVLGKLVQTIETSPNATLYNVDIEAIDGVYFVRIKNGEFVWNQRVVVAVDAENK